MVRTQSQPFAFRFDPSRILALSTAIALHLLALLLLLIPLSHRAPPVEPRTPTPRWQLPVTVPTPPVPVPITQHPPTPPTAPVHPVALDPPHAIAPPVADAADFAQPADPVPAADPMDAGPTGIAPPTVGASLQYLRAPAPTYPRAALHDHLEGTVLLQVRVDVEGRPVAVDIARSSGHRLLDQAARQQVLQRWRFRPAFLDGRAVEAIGLVPVAFSLSDQRGQSRPGAPRRAPVNTPVRKATNAGFRRDSGVFAVNAVKRQIFHPSHICAERMKIS